jgi:hypothetical protein
MMNSAGRRHRPRVAALVAAAAFALVGCGADAVGRCGAYTDTVGTARITSISSAPADQHNCRNDPVRVLFDFTPADLSKASLAASGVTLTIGSGQNPPRAWAAAAGINVGADLPVTRHDQRVGPCPPTGWTFTSIDLAAALAACY